MRRPLFLWSLGLLGAALSAGCGQNRSLRSSAYDSQGRTVVAVSQTDRPSMRSTRLAASRRSSSGSEGVAVFGEETSASTSKRSPATPVKESPAIESMPSPTSTQETPALPPVRLPFDTSDNSRPPATLPSLSEKTLTIVEKPAPVPEQPAAFADRRTTPVVEKPAPIAERPAPITELPDAAAAKTSAPASRTPEIPFADRDVTQTKASVPTIDAAPTLGIAGEKAATPQGSKSLTGHVASFRKTWRLRYAAVENEDPLGGSVVLSGVGVDRLRDGQLVRVQGSIVPPPDRTQPAIFQVQAIEVLAPAN